MLLSSLLVRSLPLALSSHVAAFLIKEDRWNGGAAMMQLANPGNWPGVVDAVQLVRSNESVLAECREAAAEAKHEQRCTIAVAAP